MRVFFGLPVPDAAAAGLQAWRRAVAQELPEARLTTPANLHATLRFIGEVDAAEAGRLSGVCLEVAAGAAPIDAAFAGLELLPSAARPRVVCLRVREGAAELQALADALRRRLGGGRDRRFLAHVTVARVRRALPPAGERLRRLRLPAARGAFRSLVLFRSVLQPSGADYQPLQAAPLGQAAAPDEAAAPGGGG